MKISDLKVGMRNVNTEGVIIGLGEIREVNMKDGSTGRVRGATLADDTGDIKLSLWGEDATRFSVGEQVKIENGYTNQFCGVVQLSVGKFGKISQVVARQIISKIKKEMEK